MEQEGERERFMLALFVIFRPTFARSDSLFSIDAMHLFRSCVSDANDAARENVAIIEKGTLTKIYCGKRKR